jgi:flavin reductase (DIM6/NTAB) family NADH-FMN oxidoreductase RutF
MSSNELREAWRSFTTGVAFIATRGSRGANVMSAEWTFNVSYEPFLISVHLDPDSATAEAIDETKEFGVNIVAEEQVAAMGFAGHFTRKETDKLSSIRFETFEAKSIKVPMIRDCLLAAECRLVQRVVMGDHVAFVGEVVDFAVDPAKKPVVLHRGSRFLGERIVRKEEVVLAATARGDQLVVEGELAGPERGGREVDVEILGNDGTKVASGDAKTDEGGFFEVALPVPGRGEFRALARAGRVAGEAKARL